MESEISYPEDLLAAQRAYARADAELTAYSAGLPSWEEVSGDAARWTPDMPPLGQSAEQAEELRRLRKEAAERAATVGRHPFWQHFSGPELVSARMGLRRAAEHVTDEDGHEK